VPSSNGPETPEILTFGPFRFDRRNGLLRRDGTEIVLAAKARDLLECLLAQPGNVVPKEELLERVWGDTAVTDHSLTEAVRSLRKVLDDDPRRPQYIQTVHRKGYRFIAPVVAVGPMPAAATRSTAVARAAPWVLVAAGAIAGAVAVGLFVRAGGRATPGAPERRVELTSSWGMAINALSRAPLAISRDGTRIAYLGRNEEGGSSLYVRRLDRDGEVRIAGRGIYAPTFSPDGESVAYFEYGVGGEDRFVLKTARADGGGLPNVLAERLSFPHGASWTVGDMIVFSTRDAAGLWGVPANGAMAAKPLANPEPGTSYWWPQVLPQSNTVIVTARGYDPHGDQITQIVAVSLETGDQRTLLPGGGRVRYISSGHLIVGRDDKLLAVPFNPETLEISAKPQVVLQDVAGNALAEYAAFDVSDDGTLVYVPAELAPLVEHQMQLVSPNGTTQPLPGVWRFGGGGLAMSPDGLRVAFLMVRDDSRDIFVYDLEREGSPSSLTSGGLHKHPIWTPEGNRLTYSRFTGDNYDLYWAAVETGEAEPLVVSEHTKYASSWSPDGQTLAYTEEHPDTNGDIWLLPMGTREPVPFLRTAAEEWGATFSPDGKWIAYHTDESGDYEIWIRPVPENLSQHDPGVVGYRKKVTTDCGGWPVWAPDGKGLFFRDCRAQPEDSFSFVPIEWEPEPIPGTPELLFAGEYLGRGYGVPAFSMSPDGSFLLGVRLPSGPRSPPYLKVRFNWFDELARLVPVGR